MNMGLWRTAGMAAAALCIAQCWAVDGTKINGRAVSAHWRYSLKNWGPTYNDAEGNWDGALDLFTINNGKVVKVDTIFKATQGLCYNPAFDINGCKIAFYRLGRALSTSTAKVTANGGKTTISVMNIDGSNVVNLVDCAGEPCMAKDGDGGLDWPAGDWIYYLKPVANGGFMNELWKVNISTRENVSVCSYALGGGRFRRLSTSLAANKIGHQTINGTLITSSVSSFPGGCSLTGGGGCNAAISPSGNYWSHFMGSHQELILEICSGVSGVKPPPTYTNAAGGTYTGAFLLTFQAHCPDRFGESVEGMGFACNSDKWIMQHVGWYGHAESMIYGTEQVATNWADMVAIRISNNGKIPRETCPTYGIPGPDCCGGCGAIYYGNEFGDLWVDGGQTNAGKYEDGDGNWHSVPGAGTNYIPAGIVHVTQALPSGRNSGAMRIAPGKQSIDISLPENRAWTIIMVDSRGRIVVSQRISGNGCSIPQSKLPKGITAVRARSQQGELHRALVID